MPSNTQGSVGREYNSQMVHYLRKNIDYTMNGQTVYVGTLPAGAQIIKPMSGVAVNVAFNGATTNTLDIGPTSDPGTDLWATVLALGAIAFVPLDEVVSLTVAADTPVSAKVVSTTGASAGAGVIVIAYLPNNDNLS